MPSMRQPALNPRTPGVPQARPAAGASMPAPRAADTEAIEVATAGGFHESSYELQHGMNITESAWPDDVTLPGRLADC